MELILIRHGLPEKVVTTDGTPADPPLSAIGLKQAELVAEYLNDTRLDRLYSSPMRRAQETALPLAREQGLEIETEQGVAEYDRDAGSYIPVEQLKEENYEQWQNLMKGEMGSVDFSVFYETVVSALTRLVDENRGKTIAVACHGGVVNVWAAHVLGLQPGMFFNPNYTSLSRFKAASTGEKSIVTLNEHFHLKALS
ncbi:MAG: histidine phosphatase family protein [Gammaproteobacteria bacterium]|jgi:2,3-bisphosphoglycerate-dependent phosphoglycerate mutase|nr:histidine phosphatase family protein [Gammaproteobacteria bacterium]MBT5201951.1 histidine phosphatase family protein [Gammaproteobacteria bacterium]MBT5603309.1 histidine phosphatase family protein [Gammaproteobacteria bacterium]MBT6244597.1 histidine phosphatase family protein [Gammaproteobacteria bacterium]